MPASSNPLGKKNKFLEDGSSDHVETSTETPSPDTETELLVADAEKQINPVSLEERALLLNVFGRADDAHPRDKTLTDLCRDIVVRHTEAPAIVDGDTVISYGELWSEACWVAHRIDELVTRDADTIVAIALPRSAASIICILGTTLAGAAYLPLDTSHTSERLQFMLRDANVSLFISNEVTAENLNYTGPRLDPGVRGRADEPPAHQSNAQDLAYVMYTSGSTGAPKGVAVTQRAVIRLVVGAEYLQLTADDVVLQCNNLSFDPSTLEIWGALLSGSTLVVVQKDELLCPQQFRFILQRRKVTWAALPAALFHALAEAEATVFSSLHTLLVGGETICTRSVNAVLESDPPRRFFNAYGPTECTTNATVHLVDGPVSNQDSIPIGRPVPGTQVYVLNEFMELCPIGIPGEICLGGDGLAREYLNLPEATAKAFVNNPFVPGKRLYRTGDIGQWRPNGVLEFIGRRDNQIKIRGHRVELNEINTELRRCPWVSDALVEFERKKSERILVGYIIPSDQPVHRETLDAYMRSRLPEYMIPNRYVWLERFPLTPNGKIDRAKLPCLDLDDHTGEGALSPNELFPHEQLVAECFSQIHEQLVAECFSQILDVSPVARCDDFFDLGGHSLSALRLTALLRNKHGLTVPLRTIFDLRTVAGLAMWLNSCNASADTQLTPVIEPRGRSTFRLSYGQEQLWAYWQSRPSSATYNESATMHFPGEIDKVHLQGALDLLVVRHDAFRTRFCTNGSEPMGVLVPQRRVHVTWYQIQHGDAKKDEAKKDLVTEAVRRPFDIEEEPLLRVIAVQLKERCDVHIIAHHIIVDGVSLHSVIAPELGELYRALIVDRKPGLSSPNVQLGDFSEWQRNTVTPNILEVELEQIAQRLAGSASLELPIDRPRPAVRQFVGKKHVMRIDGNMRNRLHTTAKDAGVSMFVLLLASFKELLRRYARQDDVRIGTIVSDRPHRELANTVGYLVNAVPLRSVLSDCRTFRDLLHHVNATTLDALSDAHVPFNWVVNRVAPNVDPSRNALFQVAFVFGPPMPELADGILLGQHELDNGGAKFDLTLAVDERANGLSLQFEYDVALYNESTIIRFGEHLKRLLELLSRDIDHPLASVQLCTERELANLDSWAGKRSSVGSSDCLHLLFEQQVDCSPLATAVSFGENSLSYRELDAAANAVAQALVHCGVEPGTLVGVCAKRSPELLIGLIGVLKAGAAYVPLDPDYPSSRLNFVVEDAQAPFILTQRHLADKFVSNQANVLLLEDISPNDAQRLSGDRTSDPESLAYVLYTSGSTGQPKGTMVTHRNVARLFHATNDWFEFNELDVWTLFHSFAFDFSVWEIWGALLYGGRLAIVPFELSRSPDAFLEFLSREQVTVLNQTPSAFRQLVAADKRHSSPLVLALRYVIFGGEKLPNELVAKWFERRGDVVPKLVNMYGITETTVHVTYRPLKSEDVRESNRSCIGVPLPDLAVYVVDPHLQRLPIGMPGEIVVCGEGVARGYFRREKLTKERFVPNPFESGTMLYRSGDLGRFCEDGELEYLGRIDQQVKLRGFRIELGDIECALMKHPNVQEAVANIQGSGENKRIVAYLMCHKEENMCHSGDLRAFLATLLPSYMVPEAFVFLASMPLSPTGKIDRNALPTPPTECDRDCVCTPYCAPNTSIEKLLVPLIADLLGLVQVGIDDDFFELGGNSLKAAQLIAAIRERIGVSVEQSSYLLGRLLDNSTARHLGNAIEQLEQGIDIEVEKHWGRIDFEKESALDHTFKGTAMEPSTPDEPRTVFLTGATGFLGTFLLLEILEQTDAMVYCLVRAPNDDFARKRLQQCVERCTLGAKTLDERVVFVNGDLSRPQFGLDRNEYQQLADTVDVIYHNGAQVNFIYPYEALRDANVGGTKTVIELATQRRVKPVHYVSSLSVMAVFGLTEGKRTVSEDQQLAYPERLHMGYLECKWVSERLLQQAAERGLPVTIHRPKDITGHSRTGYWKTESFMCSFLRSFVEMGSVPNSPILLDFLPVDFVSRAIVHATRTTPATGQAFHLSNHRSLTILDAAERLNARGYPIRTLPHDAWVKELLLHSRRNPKSPISSFVSIFVDKMLGESITLPEMYFGTILPNFDTENMDAALSSTDIRCPPVDENLLDLYFNYFEEEGFLRKR